MTTTKLKKSRGIEITNEWLSEYSACSEGVKWFQSQKETNSIKVLKKLIKEKQWDWFRWLAPRLMTHPQKVEWSIFCAEQVIHIFENKYPNNDKPIKAIEAAKAWLKDPTEENKKAADAAAAAAYAAAAATADAYAAAAYAAAAAAYAAAYAAADAAADAAAAYAATADAYAAAAARNKIRNICADEALRILMKK